MPLGSKVGENIKELRRANKSKKPDEKRSAQQILAISLESARREGANIPQPSREQLIHSVAKRKK